jgi:hypothetical protein
MKKQILFLALVVQFLASCSNDEKGSSCQDSLPAITTTGANTFGCCINGNLLIPRDGTGTFGGSDRGFIAWADPTGNNQYGEIDIKDYKSDRTASLLLHIQNISQIEGIESVINESNGSSNIDGFFHNYIHCRVFNETTNSYQYYRSFENSGSLTITKYDFNNRIISCTFNCLVKNSADSTDIIEIKNGRFDFNGTTISNAIFP